MRLSVGPRTPRRHGRARLFVLCAVVLVVLGLGVGGGYAYWTTQGTGSGVASTGTTQDVTVVAATGTPSSTLIPGATANLVVQLNNPNSYSVTIVGIAQNTGGTVGVVGGPGGCTGGNAAVSVPTQTSGLSITVASGSGVSVEIPNAVSMGTGSDTRCQGATYQIPVLLTVVHQ